jgi:hypothetical protein
MACLVPSSTILRNPKSICKNLVGRVLCQGSGLNAQNVSGLVGKNSRNRVLNNILLASCCLVAVGLVQTVAAQVRGSGQAGGGYVPGGVRMSAPPRPAIPAPQAAPRPQIGGPHAAGVASGGLAFPPAGPIRIFQHRFFFGRPFFRFPLNSPFYSFWWPTCSSGLGWGFGLDCAPQPFYGFGFGNYVTPPIYEVPVYWYAGSDTPQIWLYMKDGSLNVANDYWFVNGELHFIVIGQDPLKPMERVVPKEQLDVQKTTYVNSARGYRMVVRDAPWPQYLKDHPDANPPELGAPEKKE